jgi:hypothetical protein
LAVTCLSIKDAIIVFQAKLVLVQNVPPYCGDIYHHPHSILHISYNDTVFLAVVCSFDCNFLVSPHFTANESVAEVEAPMVKITVFLMIMGMVAWRWTLLLRVDRIRSLVFFVFLKFYVFQD